MGPALGPANVLDGTRIRADAKLDNFATARALRGDYFNPKNV